MTRKEWRAYNKRMKEMNKKSKEFPDQTTVEELKELTDWHWEKARRYDKAAKIPQVISIVGWSITFICLIASVIIALAK